MERPGAACRVCAASGLAAPGSKVRHVENHAIAMPNLTAIRPYARVYTESMRIAGRHWRRGRRM
jgi:hypothetical protein